jgi:hypothetical protein
MTRVPLFLGAIVTAIFGVLMAPPGTQLASSPMARVLDAVTWQPIPGAIVTAGRVEMRTDGSGSFRMPDGPPEVLGVRAYGYRRADVGAKGLTGNPADILLTPFRPKGLYMSVYGIGDNTLRTAALKLIGTTDVNTLVIDMKGDRGIIPYRSSIALASAVGAQKIITIKDLPALMSTLRARGIYTIARIVVFKDHLLASGRPDLAIHRKDGSVFRDSEKLSWTNPYSREVWRYNIAVATEAAAAGFDEIQFDYVRLPDSDELVFQEPQTEDNREAAVNGFLREARTALMPFNVFLAADVFGYVCWNTDDTGIGQDLPGIAGIVDYVSPMLYPSGFQLGIPGFRNPMENPHEIVELSLKRGVERLETPAVRFRPWLQAFRDYAFGGRPFGRTEIQSQIKAAEDAGSDGWMLWNPRNEYAASDIAP